MAVVLGQFRPFNAQFEKNAASLSRTFFALLYMAIVVLTPWELLLGSEYEDKASFLVAFNFNTPVLELLPEVGWFAAFLNEFLWDFTVRSIAEFTGGYETALLIITCFCSFVISRFVFRHYFGIISFVLLLNPIVIDLVSSQLRFALATSLSLLLYDKGGRIFKAGVLLILASIHTVLLLILPILWYSQLLAVKLKGRSKWKFLLYILVPVGILVLILGPAREFILGAIGDRRAEYGSDRIGFGYASAWIVYLMVVMLHGRKIFEQHITIVAFIFVALFLVMSAAGLYGVRLLANVYPFFIISMKFFNREYRFFYQILFFGYQVMQWLYWSKIV